MYFKAAVLVKKNIIKILNLKRPKLKKFQVFVKILYSSICHTQLSEIKGQRGVDNFLPHCLGHEAIGVVTEKHKTVKKVNVNDFVCLSWIKGSGNDTGGITYKELNGLNVNAGPVHTFSEYSVISENRIYKLNNKKNLKSKVLLGCALSTAFNALNKDLIGKSKSICILGAGGLGISCLILAKKMGIQDIIVIDKVENKLKLAKKLGATFVNKSIENIQFKKKIDIVVECTGNIEILKKSVNLPKYFGGKLIFIGNYPNKSFIKLDPWKIIRGISFVGAWNTTVIFDSNFKKLEKISSNINLKDFFGDKNYRLENINQALKDFENGKVLRPLIRMQ